jgi:hypothetical protein
MNKLLTIAFKKLPTKGNGRKERKTVLTSHYDFKIWDGLILFCFYLSKLFIVFVVNPC